MDEAITIFARVIRFWYLTKKIELTRNSQALVTRFKTDR